MLSLSYVSAHTCSTVLHRAVFSRLAFCFLVLAMATRMQDRRGERWRLQLQGSKGEDVSRAILPCGFYVSFSPLLHTDLSSIVQNVFSLGDFSDRD
jgi:hypothetical protein